MPAPFIYQNDIPAANDELSVSQGDIQVNFASIQSFVDVNHVDFADVDAGKHKWITFPSQGAIPPVGSAFSATEIGVFNAVSNSQQELFINKTSTVGPTTSNIPFTQSTLSTNPTAILTNAVYTYLPSGFIIQAQQFSAANNGSVVNFPIAFPHAVISVVVSLLNPTAGPSTIGASNLTVNGFTVRSAPAGAVNASYIAIGY